MIIIDQQEVLTETYFNLQNATWNSNLESGHICDSVQERSVDFQCNPFRMKRMYERRLAMKDSNSIQGPAKYIFTNYIHVEFVDGTVRPFSRN